MSRHIGDTRLNDYVEGLLTEDVARQVEAHLAACEPCSERLEALALLVSELGDLPADAMPARDLWTGVRSQIEAGPSHSEGEIHGEGGIEETMADQGAASPIWRRGAGRSRRFSLSVAQLLAASVVLTLLSGGTVRIVLSGGAGQDAAPTGNAPVAALDASGLLPAPSVTTTEYRQAIASLESVLDQGRDQLGPETIATVEASLAAIDQAIAEAHRALAADPNNDVLNRLLIKSQQAKLRVLRQASAAVQM